MVLRPEQQRLTPVERENLVAYLDGELNEAERQAISTKLTQSLTARREVELLEQTWALLDHLSRPQVSETFTERTLSQAVLLDARGGEIESAVKRAAGRFVRLAAWVLASCLACGVGYAATVWVWPNRTARLARDLPLAEHLDEYRDVRDMGFLKELLNSPEFGGERGD